MTFSTGKHAGSHHALSSQTLLEWKATSGYCVIVAEKNVRFETNRSHTFRTLVGKVTQQPQFSPESEQMVLLWRVGSTCALRVFGGVHTFCITKSTLPNPNAIQSISVTSLILRCTFDQTYPNPIHLRTTLSPGLSVNHIFLGAEWIDCRPACKYMSK